MRMTLRDGMPEACKATLAPKRCTKDGEIEGTDLLAALRCRGEVSG
jgi:hypothetical protein